MQNKLRTAAVVVAAIVIAVGTWLAYDKYTRRIHVIEMVKDAGARVRIVLQADPADSANVDLESHATVLEGYSAALRRMNTSSFTPLADAADDYLLTSREIARRAVDAQRARSALTSSVPSLSQHIKTDRGAASWPAEALRLRQAVDKDIRDYRIAVDAYRAVLGTFLGSQAHVSSFVAGMPLTEDTLVKAASTRALDAYRAAEQNVKHVTDLAGYAARR